MPFEKNIQVSGDSAQGHPVHREGGSPWWSDLEQKCLMANIILFFVFRVFDAPIRYFLAKAGVSPLSSLPSLFICLFLLLYLLKVIFSWYTERYVFYFAVIFFYSLVVGYLYIGNYKQIGIGFYAFFPFFLGLISHGVFTANFQRMKPFFFLCWLFSVVGIFLSMAVTPPWVGLTYQNFGVEVEGTREWSTFGISRVAGFSRSSFEAALTVLLLMTMQIALLRGVIVKTLLCVISGVAIAVTTTKTIVVVYLLLITYVLTRSWRWLWRVMMVILMLVVVILPVTTYFVSYDLNITDVITKILLLSFEDRLVNTWPKALKLLTDHGSTLLGRGIGGIGGAQQYFEKSIQNPADNFFLYLYVTFGIAALPILYGFWKRGDALVTAQHSTVNYFFFLLFLSVMIFGITANVVEAPFFGFLLGAFVMYKPEAGFNDEK